MTKEFKITKEQAIEARKYMKATNVKRIYRRLEVIALRGEGKKNKEVVEITGFSNKYVPQIVSMFMKEGFDKLLKDGRVGGNSRKVSKEDEEKFFEQYKEKANKGQLITAREMRVDFHTF
ncbi:hypothetical protein SAMN02745116_00268 [Pilibacter termitis]|uniref:Winged helix-turn helix n=1 Tax=Pilibacter termitis TaxID=263852 RepID=A0A1T4KI63_9ENTE|nr:helix-turn-helix domain-containing protein [Pilibacter termitis]SJZ42033.1 hypothetical protein SAMN02745116_00268 [Pilibacter termitis]